MSKKSIRKQLYWNTLLKIPTLFISFVISIITARLLDPKDYGIIGIAMMAIGYANLLTNFGLNQAIIQKSIVDKRVLNSIFTINFILSFLLACLFFFYAGLIADFFEEPQSKLVIKVLSSIFIITSFHAVPHAILRRNLDFKAVSLIDITQAISISVLTLTIVLIKPTYWALVFGQIIPQFSIILILNLKARFLPKFYISISLLKDVFNFGLWNFVKSQIEYLIKHIDKFIVGKFLGTTNLGLYDKAMSIAIVPSESITMNIHAVMFSSFSKYKNDSQELNYQFKKSLVLISVINLPIYLGLISIAPFFVHSLLGEKWSLMIQPFQIILIGVIFKSYCGLISSLNIGIGKYKEQTTRTFWAMIIFIVSCFSFLFLGLNGIAISFIILYISLFVLTTSVAIKWINISWLEIIKSITPVVIGAGLMYVSVLTMSLFVFQEYTILNLIYLSVFGAIIFTAFVMVSKNSAINEIKGSMFGDIKKISLYLKKS